MSESAKTIAFVVVGFVALAAAYFIDRPSQAVSTNTLVGTMLNTDFEVDAPKRLKVVKFDRQTAETRQFEVANVDGVWSIPSKEGYPADATQQMADAANALIDRKVLRVAGGTADTHDEFGVVDPLASSLDSNSTGVGTRVTMYDGDEKSLVDMIIGKSVKGAEGQRYVRESNKDAVYIVELDPASLSTSFDDWIEDDLLKISPFDITKVFINDYSADLSIGLTADGRFAPQINWERRGEITLGYSNDDAKWNLLDLKKYDRQSKQMVPDKMADDEELNQDALSELRNGLDDLLIVDVAKKPEGLSADLKAGNDFLTNRDAFEDLVAKGFSPVPIKPNAPPEILSSEGEIVTTTRDGVEYVLRFGQLKVQSEEAEGETATAAPADPATGEAATAGADPAVAAAKAGDPAAGDPASTADADGKNLHRYLFVMARFNQDAIAKPELKELPTAPTEPAPADAETEQQPASDEAAGDAAEAGDAAAPPAEEPATPPAGGDEEDAAPADSEPTDEAAAPAADAQPAATGKPAAATSANDGEAARATEEPPQGEAAESEPAEPSAADKLAEERKAVEEENKRLQDRYDEEVEAGKKRVGELNERFGDWYYVISNDVYKQIHLGRDQVIKKKASKEDDAAAGAADSANPLSALPNLPGAAKSGESAIQSPPAEDASGPAPLAEAPAQDGAPKSGEPGT